MKKILITITTIIFMINGITSPRVLADDIDEEYEEIGEEDLKETVETASNSGELQINSRNVAVFDRTSKQVIYGKNENKKTAMASTTKIITSIVVLENANLKDEIEISASAAGIGGSRLGLKKGDKISVLNLLYGLMLRSGNDAAYALAEYVGGSKEGFAELMNKKAEELNLKNTHFVTPHGLDDPEHYTTATELAILTDYALENKTFVEIVNTKTCTIYINGNPRTINNTNELLGNLYGVNGVKTGFTNNAGRCLVTSVNRDNWNIITVVLGADTKKIRTTDSINLIEYTYKNYSRVNIEEMLNKEFNNWKNINQKMISINKCKNSNLELELEFNGTKIRAIKNTQIDNIEFEINVLSRLEAPVEKGRVIGNIIIKNGDEVLDIAEVKNKYEVEKKGVEDYLKIFLNELVNGDIIKENWPSI